MPKLKNKQTSFLNGKGASDVLRALKTSYLPIYLAHSDIRQRYRRSTLGPFWITISTGVMVACIGLIFGGLFKTPIYDFLPFLAIGLILWNFISSCLTEATTVFASSEAIIKQLSIPLFSHVLRMLARNFFIFLHNIIIVPIVLLIVKRPIGWDLFYVMPGLLLLLLNLMWISLSLAIVCARYRDLTQIVVSILQIFFYVTPIIWMPSLLSARKEVMLLDPNPFYHLIELIRLPLMNQPPSLLNWLYPCALLIIGWSVTLLLFNKYRSRVAYWL